MRALEAEAIYRAGQDRHRSPVLDKHLGEYVRIRFHRGIFSFNIASGVLDWADEKIARWYGCKPNMYILLRGGNNINFYKSHVLAIYSEKREPV